PRAQAFPGANAVRSLRAGHSVRDTVLVACHCGPTCTDRKRPRPKNRAAEASNPHVKSAFKEVARVAGYYLPSQWSGWSIRTRPKRAKSPQLSSLGLMSLKRHCAYRPALRFLGGMLEALSNHGVCHFVGILSYRVVVA